MLVGPTAVGKTKFSIEIAKKWNAEVISGDSMQVYRGMDIGTAKASAHEQHMIKHHLIDICSPEVSYSVADFQQDAKQAIQDIYVRDKLPLLVGGTGLYIESVCYEYQFSWVGNHPVYRQTLEQFADLYGDEALHAKLVELDPISANRLHPHDRRRIIRSLEIAYLTGSTHSTLLSQQTKNSPYQLCMIGLTMDRKLLYERIEQRIDEMLDAGLIIEVKKLLQMGCPIDSTSMQALGYKELIQYLDQQLTYEQAVSLFKQRTRNYAKRQLSWFRHMKELNWIDVSISTNFTTQIQEINDIISSTFLRK